MEPSKELKQAIAEKSGLLHTIIAKKFGGNAEAAATSGEDNQTGGGNTMRVTRSAGSGAPGEVQDGKLVDVKALAAAAARNDVPPTDLLALARQNDPHNEETIPTTIAGAVTASDKGLPGQQVAEDKSMDGALGSIETENKQQLHQKQHPAIQKAVETKVEGQVSDTDPYKSLHASSEVDQIVARAKAVLTGADAIRSAATEVSKNPGAGKVEDGGQGKAGGDANKNPQESAKTLGDGGAQKGAGLGANIGRKDVLAAIKAEMVQRAKVEGALVDPAKKEGAGQTPEEGAASMGDGGSEKSASNKVAEGKDRPLASMPEGKSRYKRDEDGRDDEAKSYWKKNKADESRFDKEPEADRPITKEKQEKMPKLSTRQNLFTRLAALGAFFAAAEDEAARLHLKRRTYNKDEAQDMDYGGAAGRTKSEINKEHGQRSSESGSLSPMMSRLWSAYMPNVRLAAEKGYSGSIAEEGKASEMKKQVSEMQAALKGLKAEDQGGDQAMSQMQSKIEGMESEIAKASGINLGIKSIAAMAATADRLAVIGAALGDIHRLCRASHLEVKFALEKPHGTGVSDDMVKLLEDLGETCDDMEGVIDMALKEMGHPGLKDKDPLKKEGPEGLGEPKGPDMGKPELPGMGGGEGAGAPSPMPPMGAAQKAPVKTAFEIEDDQVEKVASDEKLSADERKTKVASLRGQAKWGAEFHKVASKDDAKKADVVASYWEVKRDGQTILKVTAGDAYPVKTAKEQEEAFAWFATKDYGATLLASAKFEGTGKTAKLLGLVNVRTAAGAFDEYSTKRPASPDAALDGAKKMGESDYYAKAYGSSEFASELLKKHEQKAAVERAGLEAKIATLESEKKAEKDRNDRLQSDLAMRARAVRALDLAQKAMAKGMFGTEHKASFIDKLMQGDESGFAVTSELVEAFKPVAAAPEKKAEITAKDLLKQAAAGPGLKIAIVSEAAPAADLASKLNTMWRTPPTAKV